MLLTTEPSLQLPCLILMMVLKYINLPSSPPPTRGSRKEKIWVKWTCLEMVLWSRLHLRCQQFSSQVSSCSSIHSQTLHGYTSSVGIGAARPQQEGPGPTGTPEVLGCSSISEDWRPTNITQLALYSLCGVPTHGAQLHNIRQTNQYMPVIHVSFHVLALGKQSFTSLPFTCVCFSKMFFHICPSKTPSNTTDFPKNP